MPLSDPIAGTQPANLPEVNFGFDGFAGSVDGRPEQLRQVEASTDVSRDKWRALCADATDRDGLDRGWA